MWALRPFGPLYCAKAQGKLKTSANNGCKKGFLMARDHFQRLSLNDELHGRPALNLKSPGAVSHFAFIHADAHQARRAIANLCATWQAPLPQDDAQFHRFEGQGLSAKWELHGEFYTFTLARADGANEAFTKPAAQALPDNFLNELPGERLVAIHIAILNEAEDIRPQDYFGHEDLAGARVTDGLASLYTDFRIGPDGFSRAILHDHAIGPQRLARLLRRFLDIETYRMMALLSFPVARALQAPLSRLEKQLTQMVAKQDHGDEKQLLSDLQSAHREIEEISNTSSFRFAAARAYAALVSKRIADLREERIPGIQRIGTFLERRFSPAMSTCEAAERRLNALAQRFERVGNLMRTRVDIELEAQNQGLLSSLEASSRRQLRLQQTVEGLSVVAISYYSLAILGKLFEGAEALHWITNPKLAEAIAAPFIIGIVWYLIRRLRAHLLQ